MGLYLTVFDGADELDGVEVGGYDDFAKLRQAVTLHVELGIPGSRCPTLIEHSDCDGQWSSDESRRLELEILRIAQVFKSLPPVPLDAGWQRTVAKQFGVRPKSLFDCFFDVDGEPLLDRLLELARLSQERNLPILFQ